MPKWMFETFITADNNLFRLIGGALKQFRTANPRNVNVLVQVDSPHYRTKRLILNPDGSFPTLPPTAGTRVNLNAGKVKTLVNFLFTGKHIRQSVFTAAVLNGHGTGFTDFTKM